MALNLYLDDCANASLLADLLVQAGHTVVRPGDVGMLGVDDDAHLAYAAAHGLILVTKDPDDFLVLHRAATRSTTASLGSTRTTTSAGT